MSYRNFTGKACDFYVASDEIADIVNLGILLGRPILVEGEAGCGKTMLASAIAAEVLDPPDNKPITVTIKSTYQAEDLLYRFDALRRLQDIQDPKITQARFIYPYITLQLFGKAIHAGKPCVVLVDGKADIDFPNDLLEVIDRFSFDIDDLPLEEATLNENKLGRRVTSREGNKPIVVITSNREKQLPEPFLRRCLYIELRFPTDTTVLAAIVEKNIKDSVEKIIEDLTKAAIERFLAIRTAAEGLKKPPATSELIDWIKILHWRGQTPEQVIDGGLQPPYWRLLFKTMQDLHAYAQRSQGETR